jgi:membrane fusion protein, multidrug efflux system
MKSLTTKAILAAMLTSAILIGCGGDKTAKLAELKKQQSELAKQITDLEQELALTDTTKTTVRMKDVGVTELATRKFDYYIKTQGLVESRENILVSAKSMGVITSVFVTEGQAVTKGQVLAVIDNAITVRSIEEVKASMELVNTIYEKQKNLWEQKIGTEVQYLQAKNNKESLEKRLATLEEQLDMSRIKSPINGTVDAVNLKIGENATPGVPAFRVINTNNLKVKASVSEAYITSLAKGNTARIEFPDLNRKVDAKVTFVGRNIDPLSRSFPVEIDLPTATDLRPSMTAVLRIVYQTSSNAICVPVNIVQEINGEKVVYVQELDGNQMVARRKVIELGGVFDNLAEVKNGLKAGDKIITVGYQGLNDGEFIKI